MIADFAAAGTFAASFRAMGCDSSPEPPTTGIVIGLELGNL